MTVSNSTSLRFTARHTGSLLDILAQETGGSRRSAKRLLDARCVFVNGRRIWMARHRVRLGDRVETMPAVRPSGALPIRVLYDDGACLVADKPAGLVTTGRSGVEGRLRVQHGNPSLTAVHRLDRDTTGCLLLAYGETVRAAIVALFRKGEVGKLYEAIVRGRVSGGARVIQTPIEGKRAVTELSVCAAGAEASHVRVRIVTGRTHQIRRHLAGIGHPVLGDRDYGTSEALPPVFRSVHRPMLHAVRLRLPHPETDSRLDIHAPLPDDFRKWLKKLRLGSVAVPEDDAPLG